MKPAQKGAAFLVICLTIWAYPAICSAESSKALWLKIQTYLQKGDELTACKYIERLSKRSKDSTYRKAAAYLLKRHGISIEDPRSSYTAKQLIKLQNILREQYDRTGKMPRFKSYPKYRDAWGNALRCEWANFQGRRGPQARSAGPDKRFMTKDDLVLESSVLKKNTRTLHKLKFSGWRLEHQGESVSQNGKKPKPKKPAGQTAHKWKRPSASGATGYQEKPPTPDRTVTLENLLNTD
jgi:hypothetical protein